MPLWSRFQIAGWLRVTGLLLAFAVPFVVDRDDQLFLGSLVCVYILAGVGMNILHGYAGQVSLGQGGLIAVGAYVTAILSVKYSWNIFATLGPAVGATVALGLVMALPALRLSRWLLGMVTLVMGTLVQQTTLEWQGVTGGGTGLVGVPPLTLGDRQLALWQTYYVLVGLVVISVVIMHNIGRSPTGLAMRAVRDSDAAARSVGASSISIKVVAFGLGAVFAGLAGSLFASLNGLVVPDQFGIEMSTLILLIVLIGGDGRLDGPVLGALVMVALPTLLTNLGSFRLAIYGLLLLLVATVGRQFANRLYRRLLRSSPGQDTSHTGEPSTRSQGRVSSWDVSRIKLAAANKPLPVRVHQVSKSFGGVGALQGVTLTAHPGQVCGVIGPNGSGKTTLMNVICGYYRADSGSVTIGETDVTAWTATRISRAGLARTFQHPQLLLNESVLDNVMLGAYSRRRATFLEWCVRVGRVRAEARFLIAEAHSMLGFVGLNSHAHRPVNSLPHGSRRLVEIARALMSRPSTIMLDEPAAGFPPNELVRLTEIVHSIRDLGLTVVLIEHNIDMVTELADQVVVLENGRVLAQGSIEEVMARGDVLAAYVGV